MCGDNAHAPVIVNSLPERYTTCTVIYRRRIFILTSGTLSGKTKRAEPVKEVLPFQYYGKIITPQGLPVLAGGLQPYPFPV